MQWYGTILPRLHTFVPAETILEIAPGYGRWTQFLKDLGKKIFLVDLSEKCIQSCKSRFGSFSHITYFVNDGKSLSMIADNSIDLVFSFDSLVHVEEDVIKAYLSQISKKLKKNGVAFLHHSNLGAYLKYFHLINKIPRGRGLLHRLGFIDTSEEGRAFSVTADKVKNIANESGLKCITQELINWNNKRILIDCISVITRNDSDLSRNNIVFKNNNFMREAQNIVRLSELYGEKSSKIV